MKTTLKILLIVYLAVMLILSFTPLTGYYAALGSLPVLGVYLYRKLILEREISDTIVTRNIFLFACVVFLFGFVMNLFCTLYTTWRMAEFRSGIEEQKKRIYGELENKAVPGSRATGSGSGSELEPKQAPAAPVKK